MVSIARILCPVDFSPSSRAALRYAAALGRWYEARLAALHVFRQVAIVDSAAAGLGAGIVTPPLTLADVDRDALRQRLGEFVRESTGVAGIELRLTEAFNVQEEILREADSWPADLLVLGSQGLTGVKRLVLGSTAEAVLRRAMAPVLIVPAHATDVPASGVPFTRIVCAVDFKADDYRALRYAFDLAQESDAHLTLLHAAELPVVPVEAEELTVDVEALRETAVRDARAHLEALVPEQARAYCTVNAVVAEGRAQDAILELADEVNADLIIMGVRDRAALDLVLFGSHTQAVVRAARCPVLTVHQG
jgi:nucleotide-binding universal stress UspA family protein